LSDRRPLPARLELGAPRFELGSKRLRVVGCGHARSLARKSKGRTGSGENGAPGKESQAVAHVALQSNTTRIGIIVSRRENTLNRPARRNSYAAPAGGMTRASVNAAGGRMWPPMSKVHIKTQLEPRSASAEILHRR